MIKFFVTVYDAKLKFFILSVEPTENESEKLAKQLSGALVA